MSSIAKKRGATLIKRKGKWIKEPRWLKTWRLRGGVQVEAKDVPKGKPGAIRGSNGDR